MEYIQVITTGPRADLDEIAGILLKERLAACVQIAGPIHSSYWWQGKIEEAEEWVAVAKTTLDLYPRVEQSIRSLHSYEVPEILAAPVLAGNPDYLAWLQKEVKQSNSKSS